MSDFLDLQGAKDLNMDAIHISAVANSVDPVTGAPIDEHVNRVGGTDYTFKGLLGALGPVVMPWTSITGGTLTQPNQAFLHPANGNYYSWAGAYPVGGYVVAPGTDPTLPGSGYVPRIDTALRAEIMPSVSEALRRSYADAGYNLVTGSFEDGGSLTTISDVLLHKATGKAYSGPVGVVAAGTNPLSGGYVPRTDAGLRAQVFNGPLATPIAEGRQAGLQNLPATKDFTAPGYFDTGVLIDAIIAARSRGGVVNSNTPLNVDSTTFSGVNAATNTILSGTSDISGIPRKSVSRPWRGQYVPTNTINPWHHLPRMMERASPVIVMFGDSLSTQGPNTPSGIQSMDTILRNKFIKDNPTKNIKWYNRSIGGQTFTGANSIPSNLDYFNPSWYTDHSRAWWEYVRDLNPDVLVIAFGMNDGGSINPNEFFALMAKIKAWVKVPDLLFVTTPVPSCAAVAPYTQYSAHSGQEGRDTAAGLVRSYARLFGHGCIDINRACVAMRDGYDVISNPTRAEETVNASFYKATKACTDFSFTAELDCALWDSTSKVVSCRVSEAPDYIFLTLGSNRELIFGGYCTGFGNYKTTPTGYILPTTGTIFLDVGVFGGVAKLITWTSANIEDRIERATIPLLRAGGEYRPWLTFGQGQDTGPFKKITFNRGYKFPKYSQAITDLELWGPSTSDAGTKPGFGGNGINHYSSIGLDLVVSQIVDALDLSAPVDVYGSHADGQWAKLANGMSVYQCKKRISFSCPTAFGSIFSSGYLMFTDFPQIFKSDGAGGFEFSASIQLQLGGTMPFWLGSAGPGTGNINDAVYFSILSPVALPSANTIDLNVTMIGWWK